ncbi:MAG TPA: hypothetical protein PLX14_01115, partial [Anaerolineales bacterium]|nr:hypothetical protein [Anaerolineales bacterium]
MLKNRTALILSVALWLLLALAPWQNLLAGVEILRFAIGFIIYVFPGALTFLALSEDRDLSPKALLAGLLVAVFVTGLLGVTARFLQLNMTFIRGLYAVWGAAILLWMFLKNIKISWRVETMPWWEAILLFV